MKFPVPADGRVIHAVGNSGLNQQEDIDDYERVFGGSTKVHLPAVYSTFEALPGTRGIGPTLKHIEGILADASVRRVGVILGLRFVGPKDTPTATAVAEGLHDADLEQIGDLIAAFPEVPLMIRPGTEINFPGFNNGPRAKDAYQNVVTVLRHYCQFSACWGTLPNGDDLSTILPDPETVDWVGIDLFDPAGLEAWNNFEVNNPVAQNIHRAVKFSYQHDLPICVPEASRFERGLNYVTGETLWSEWASGLLLFCSRPRVKLLATLPQNWVDKANDMRFYNDPLFASWWSKALSIPNGFIHREEFRAQAGA